MSDGPDRGNATLDKISGNVKSFVGGVINNDDLRKTGEEEKAKGEAQYRESQAQDAAEATGENIKGSLQKNLGGIVSDEQKAKGEANLSSAEMKEEKSKH